MASGEWRVASGEWRVASGEWRKVSTRQIRCQSISTRVISNTNLNIIRNQLLSDLNCVSCRTFTYVISHNPHV
ncbi:hypothetical protein FD717_000400 [Photobacterium damselae subsp. damselae]|nr:hypothetical protein FD717_000400 [Photobacterium damselae subsp. damselae]